MRFKKIKYNEILSAYILYQFLTSIFANYGVVMQFYKIITAGRLLVT